jgi:O-antigen/teichoic acid export membrane protein
MPLITFSLPAYYSRNYFYIDAIERESLRNRIITMILIFSGCMSILSVIGLWSFCKITNVSFPFFPYAIISIASIFFNGMYSMMVVDLKLKRKASQFFKLHIMHAIISAAITILLVIIVKWAAIGKMLAPAITAMIFCIYSIKKMLTKLEFDFANFKKVLLFCWPLAIAASLNFFFSGVDRPMLERLHDEKSLGLYNIAITITGYLSLFSTAISDTFQRIFFSHSYEAKKENSYNIGRHYLLKCYSYLNIYIICLSNYKFTYFWKVYCFCTIFQNSCFAKYYKRNLFFYFFSHNWLWLDSDNFIYKLLGSVIAFIMFRVLISRFGFYGAAWGQVFSFLIMSMISIIFIFGQGKAKKLSTS